MPASSEISTVVNMNEGVSGVDISRWTAAEGGFRSLIMKAGAESPDGRVQRVNKKNTRRPKFVMINNNENSHD